jgi:import inner membrane translocase subunit TIM23
MSSSSSRNQGSSSHDTATDYIRSATFSRPDGPSSENAVTASDLLMGAYDPTKLHPLADLGDKLDYLLLDDDKTNDLPGAGTAIPSRGWSDDLCYGTGTMYLSGKWCSPCHDHFNVGVCIRCFFLFPPFSHLISAQC